MNPTLLSSENHSWQTPDEVLNVVRELGPIAFDPCTSPDNPTGAERFYTEADDALSKAWNWAGVAFANPPYGRALSRWSKKIVMESCCTDAGRSMLVLTPSRTDTKWFRLLATECQAIAFWQGRITFKGANDPAPFPSAIFYFGTRPLKFARVFGEHALVVEV